MAVDNDDNDDGGDGEDGCGEAGDGRVAGGGRGLYDGEGKA